MQIPKNKIVIIEPIITLCILTGAIIFRLYVMKDWLDIDECMHFTVAKAPFFKGFIWEFKMLAHPPLAYILMKPFIAMGSSAYLAKLLSFTSGIVSLVLSYFVLKKISSSRYTLIIGLLFVSFLPAFVMQSIVVRQYSLALVFIWGSLLIYFQMKQHNFNFFSEHLYLALFFGAGLMAEYGLLFHALSLSCIIYIPLGFNFIKKRQWKNLFKFLSPLLVFLFFAGGMFIWQFNIGVPRYSHIQNFTYQDSELGVIKILIFFYERFNDLISDILPHPWGMCLIVLLCLPFIPWFYKKLPKNIRLFFRFYGVCSIGLIFMASLFRWYPFGGYPRHSVLIMPGILINCILLTSVIIKNIKLKVIKYIVTSIIIIFLGWGLIKGNLVFSNRTTTFENMLSKAKLYNPSNLPDCIITDSLGRFMVGWWLLPVEYHLIEKNKENYIYDYSGTKVIMARKPEFIQRTVLERLDQNNEVFLFLSVMRGYSEESSMKIHNFIRKRVKHLPNFSFESQTVRLGHKVMMIKIKKQMEN